LPFRFAWVGLFGVALEQLKVVVERKDLAAHLRLGGLLESLTKAADDGKLGGALFVKADPGFHGLMCFSPFQLSRGGCPST